VPPQSIVFKMKQPKLPERCTVKSRRMACCPAHEDHTPSLSITRGATGKTLLHCFAHCSQEQVLKALNEQGLWNPQPILNGASSPAIYYTYNDEEGRPLHRTERKANKEFRQQSYQNGKWVPKLGSRTVLYHLDELVARSSETVHIAEGERMLTGCDQKAT
jgi:putative DNA primase/helicase